MKKIIDRFCRIIRFIVTIFASREFGFIYCVFGTIAQVTHTWFLVNSISSFSGNFQTIQAILISTFISSSLLYFVAIADNMDDSKEAKKILYAVNIFMIIEILINIYYYTRHLIIDSPEMQLFDFIFAVIVSGLLPVTIKLYGGLIRAKDWMKETFENEVEIKNVDIEEDILTKVVDYMNNYTLGIQDTITDMTETEMYNFKEEMKTTIMSDLDRFKTERIRSYDDEVSKMLNEKFDMLIRQTLNKQKLLVLINMIQYRIIGLLLIFLNMIIKNIKLIQLILMN
jgi:hypothetical protein